MQEFAKSGHPVFTCSSPLSSGLLKSMGTGLSSIHCNADPSSAEIFLTTTVSINQLGIHRAVMTLYIGKGEGDTVDPNVNLKISKNLVTKLGRHRKTAIQTSKVCPQEQQCDELKQKAIPGDDRIHKTVYDHKNEVHEPQRCRIQECGQRSHEDHNVDRGYNFMTRYNLAHEPIRIPQSMQIPNEEVPKIHTSCRLKWRRSEG